MANAKQTDGLKRIEIFPFFEGVNGIISDALFKKGELKHCENARSTVIGSIEKRKGTQTLGDALVATANYGIFFFDNPVSGSNKGFYRISTVSAVTTVYYLNDSSVWTALSAKGTGLSALRFFHTFAEGCCFLVNGIDNNRYISDDVTTVIDSDTDTGHLKNSPKAKKIKYYRGQYRCRAFNSHRGRRSSAGMA